MVHGADGSDTSCIPTSASKPPTIAQITPNVTDKLETCQQWGLTVSGGQKPYQVVISALNSPLITNITLGPNDDVLTYINRGTPNEALMGKHACLNVLACVASDFDSIALHTASVADA